ncbi:hypothetical protein PspLS_09844 [Pyricularia sp. CBS 133598]|nr:hypothetical protein PspLS_09844 [Pyricularia sp. CBS 133598]
MFNLRSLSAAASSKREFTCNHKHSGEPALPIDAEAQKSTPVARPNTSSPSHHQPRNASKPCQGHGIERKYDPTRCRDKGRALSPAEQAIGQVRCRQCSASPPSDSEKRAARRAAGGMCSENGFVLSASEQASGLAMRAACRAWKRPTN